MSSPNTDNYQLGKGVVFFDQLDTTTGLYLGERDLGNAPAFSMNVAIEKLEHFSSRGGLRAKDKEVISQLTPSLTFTLDEITKENIALLTLAEIQTVSQVGSTVVDELHVAHLGRRTVLAYRGISLVSITNKTQADTPLVVNVDYKIDTALKDDKIGRILILETATAVDEGDEIEVSYTYATVTYTKIKAFKNTQVEGKLRFVSDNPAGSDQEILFNRVSLTASGDTSFIGEDWSTLGFAGECLKDETNADSPYYTIIMD